MISNTSIMRSQCILPCCNSGYLSPAAVFKGDSVRRMWYGLSDIRSSGSAT